jgi:hypothetical protein
MRSVGQCRPAGDAVRSARRHGTGPRRVLAEMLLDRSPLFEEKLVDPDGLRLAVHRLTEGPYREDGDARLLEVLDLHFAARSFL